VVATSPSPADGAGFASASTTLSWAGDASAQFDVFLGTSPAIGPADFAGTVSAASFAPGPLAEGTTYFWRVDSTNSGGTTAGPVWSFTTRSADAWVEILAEGFEGGWGAFASGGADASLHTGQYATEGQSAANIQDSSGDASSITTAAPIDLTAPGFEELRVSFSYVAVNLSRRNHSFYVEAFDGTSFVTLQQFRPGTDFTDGTPSAGSIALSASDFPFTSQFALRFRCAAKGNNRDVYIDDVRIVAAGGEATVTIAAESSTADEASLSQAVLRIDRQGPTALALDVPLSFAENPDPTGGSAGFGDFTLTDGAGQPVTTSVTIPAGATSATLLLTPVDDGAPEVPEHVIIGVDEGPRSTVGAPNTADVVIRDAAPTSDNDRLFIAYLGAEPGVTTVASGIGVLRLAGDNTTATIDVQFSGLTTTEIAAHVHAANPFNGPAVHSLPLGQVAGSVWVIQAAAHLSTDQSALDALYGGSIYVNVHSERYPAGEIRGSFIPQDGSTEFQEPPPPPPLPELTGADLDRDVVRFLNQATFGATPADVAALQSSITQHGDRLTAMEAWIDAQIAAPSASMQALTDASAVAHSRLEDDDNRRSAFFIQARYGADQLRQRLAFALSQIVVVSDRDGTLRNRDLTTANYYDMLMSGAFGTYRQLLEQVTLHPGMGVYLSHIRNQREVIDPGTGDVIASPDENYAREIMQLFSFGLVNRHPDGTLILDGTGLPIPTYDNDVITELAKVFTGFGFSKYDSNGAVVDNNNFFRGFGGRSNETRFLYPMKMFETYHDITEKYLFDAHVLPANQAGMTDLSQALDLIVSHPTTAPFISRLLIQRLVTSNPGRGYIYRVASVFASTGGDLGQVIKAILLDHDARSLDVADTVSSGKQRAPLLRLLGVMRLMDAASNVPLTELSTAAYSADELAKFPVDATLLRPNDPHNLGQMALRAETVFNFFLPDYAPAGPVASAGLVAPEFQLSTASGMYAQINYFYDLIVTSNGVSGEDTPPPGYASTDDHVILDYSTLQAIHDGAGGGAAGSEAALRWLDDHLAASRLQAAASDPSPNAWEAANEAVSNTNATNRLKTAVYLMVNSPHAAVEQ